MTVKLVTAAVKAPGFYGLNTQVNAAGLEMNWALKADNLVFDDGGTLGARNGWVKFANAITGTPDFVSIGEYRVSATTEKLLVSTAAKIYASSTTSTIHDTWTDKTAALTITAGYWQFVNHNGEVIGFQSAHVPVYWDGASGTNFALISAKSGYAAPDASMVWGNCGHSAYGRVWASDSTETILLWSAIGTDHQWSSASGGGFADLKITAAAWVNGVDKITAITTFQNYLVVFGKRSILLFSRSLSLSSLASASASSSARSAPADGRRLWRRFFPRRRQRAQLWRQQQLWRRTQLRRQLRRRFFPRRRRRTQLLSSLGHSPFKKGE